jgi:hypothetical protein
MHSFEVSLRYESVDRTTFSTWSATALSLKMYFGQRFHTPMKLQKNAFHSYVHTNMIICCWKLLRHWLFTSDIVMEARASSGLSFIGMQNISCIIMWPLHNQSHCNISMKNKFWCDLNVIIRIKCIFCSFIGV